MEQQYLSFCSEQCNFNLERTSLRKTVSNMKTKKRQFSEENTILSISQENFLPCKGKLDADDEDTSDDSILDSDGEEDTDRTVMGLEENFPSHLHNVDNDGDDVSDEEDLRNTVGNIPMAWYEDFPHIGYDLDGNAISKPIRNQDELDKFLEKMENKDYWRTVHDKLSARDHVLTEEELQLIERLKKGSYYSLTVNPHEPYIDFFTNEKMIHPVTNIPEHKRSFTPSVVEKRKVGKLVHAIKMGWIKPGKPKTDKDKEPKFYDLWAETEKTTATNSEIARQKMHIPAPKLQLPGHEASYNPPPEYLPTQEEIDKWKEEDEEERKLDFIPHKFECLRKVPQYPTFIQERFSRCLDLYLCPRQRKMKVMVNPEDLIPNLPKPKDLQPFPTFQALCYRGHKSLVRSISVDPTGQWLASGSDDGIVRIWEVATARCMREFTKFGKDKAIKCVSWCPNGSVCLLAVALENQIVVINPGIGDKVVYSGTDSLLQSFETTVEESEVTEEQRPDKSNAFIPPWKSVESGLPYQDGQRLIIVHPKDVSKVTWHSKGDYFASIVPENGHAQVFLHQLTKRRSQTPFTKCKGAVQSVLFHPTRPFLFVATQQYVRVYNLVKQQLTKKLMANSKWISSLAIHPGGDNLLVGSYDCRLSWFDMDLSTKPYKTMRYHKRAIRACCYHHKYPLFASGGDDGSVVVSHGMVYSDLMQNPLIVPVKVLKGHKVERNLGVLDCCFHPHQPWIFSSAADKTIRLFT